MAEGKQQKVANKSAAQYGIDRAEQKRRDDVVNYLVDAIALEARGEDVPGMALVAKSIINRRKYLKDKRDYKGRKVFGNAYLTDGDYSIMGILKADKQYQVVGKDGNLRYDKQKPLTDEDRQKARHALAIATRDDAFAELAKQEGWPSQAFNVTGFRTRKAKEDKSQNINNFTHKNHVFNTATGNPE
jgi:hypothetical protein